MQASQNQGISGGFHRSYNQPVQEEESYQWPPLQNLNNHTSSDDGSLGTHFSEQYCTFELSSANGSCPVNNSSSTISFSPNGSPESQSDSQSYQSAPLLPPDHNTLGSPKSVSCLTDDVDDLRHKLKELETAMLGPDSDTLDLHNNITFQGGGNRVSSETENWKQMVEMISTWDLKEALIAWAKAVSDNNLLTAEWLMSELRKMVSVSGEPIQRLGAYILKLLISKARLTSTN